MTGDPSSTYEDLRCLHRGLDEHFRALRDARSLIEPRSPVFALEHDLSSAELERLSALVRAGIGELTRYRDFWLPFVVYAAEIGYGYDGDEYWSTFSEATPGWSNNDRSTIRLWFVQFSERYNGARPTGAWAKHFTIIAWPITHAVLPEYLQRNLARLLFEFSGALTSALLDDPSTLGLRLAQHATTYTERFRIFCENTTLVGHVAVALLSGENEPTPYLTTATLRRITEGLSKEREAQRWLKSARASASHARGHHASTRDTSPVQPIHANPRLFLRSGGTGVWDAYAEFPDLTLLGAALPDLYGHLRKSRATVNGGSRPLPPSALLYPGQQVRLAHMPEPDMPFLKLVGACERANLILAEHCVVSPGPWRLFRLQDAGLATEVEGKTLRANHTYVLVGAEALHAPSEPWCTEVAIALEGSRAYVLALPAQLSESEENALRGAGLKLNSRVTIRPVGLVASFWDGEGYLECMPGEAPMLGIRSDVAPQRVRVTADGAVFFLDWTPGERELFVSLAGLAIATHNIDIVLLGDHDRQLTSGSVTITMRDPQVRPEGATSAEGIRLLATPARPTLTELWDGHSALTIAGPAAMAELSVTLFSAEGDVLSQLRRAVRLPLTEEQWKATVERIRVERPFTASYDQAESCTVTVSRDGIGFATLTCDRGFQPLRWRISRSHDGSVTVKLIDRTDGNNTSLHFYDVEQPLAPIELDPGAPFSVPPRGGLVIAESSDAHTASILPTDPSELVRMPPPTPFVTSHALSADEVVDLAKAHRRWIGVDRPADPFAAQEERTVGDGIARSIASGLCGARWASLERKLVLAADPADHLDDMQQAVGNSPEHRAVAATIGRNLYQWLTPESLLAGFHQVITPHLNSDRRPTWHAGSHFLLALAGRPGYITDWAHDDSEQLIERIRATPVLLRSARFAVLGTRALNDSSTALESF